MTFLVRCELVRERKDSSRRSDAKPVEKILESFEVEVETQAEGKQLIDSVSDYLEEQGFDLDDDDENEDDDDD